MDTNRETVIERLLSGYRRYYNVTRFDGGYNPPPEEFKGFSLSPQRAMGNPSGRVYLYIFRSGSDVAGL